MRKWLHFVCPGLAKGAALVLFAQLLTSLPAAAATQLYVTSQFTRSIVRYDGTDGSYIDSFGGSEINDPLDLIHGIDGHLLLSNGNNDNILSYDAETGASLGVFASGGGLSGPMGMAIGRDRNLYVCSSNTNSILRYNGATGAFMDAFVPSGSGGIWQPRGVAFGRDGNLYVASYNTSSVMRFDGTTGKFIDVFVESRSGGLFTPQSLVFGPDGDLYVPGGTVPDSEGVRRYKGSDGSFAGFFALPKGYGCPTDLTFGPDANLCVVVQACFWGTRGNTVVRFDRQTGAFLGELVPPGSGGMDFPFGLAFSSQPETTCTFQRRIQYTAQIVPDRPCEGQPLGLLITSCGECDDIVAGFAQSPTEVGLRFDSRAICPLFPCLPDSLIIPLGVYTAGSHSLALHILAVVLGIPGADTCVVYQEDTFSFHVDSCGAPPPQLLPFVELVRIGAPSPCLACSSRICPGDSIPVFVAGTFPNDCYEFRGLEVLPSDRRGPQPVRIRVAVNDCLGRPCRDFPVPWSGQAMLRGLPSGLWNLPLVETWEGLCDSTRIDSVFQATVPFEVVEQCSTVVGQACFLHEWQNDTGDPQCNAFLVNGSAQVTLRLGSNAAISGLQGDLVVNPPGQLLIANLEPVGAAAGMSLSWQHTSDGARFVLLDVKGNPIPPVPPDSMLAIQPILRATLELAAHNDRDPTPPLAEVVELGVRSLLVSDPQGQDIIPCPTFAVIPDARICTRGGLCDLNDDGVADVRDLVLMVHCVNGTGPCPDTTFAHLDCNHDGRASLDDVFCCALVVLHGGIPDTTGLRPEPAVHLSLGAPVSTSSGLDIPVRLTGANLLGAVRLVFDYPSGIFDVAGADIPNATGRWMVLHETQGAQAIVGLIAVGRSAEDPTDLDLTLHLTPRSGQEPQGEVRLSGGDFADPNGQALRVDLAPVSVPLGSGRAILLSRAEPNPFSGSTRFTLTLPRAADVDLVVHDLGGRRVATLFRGRLEAGAHPFTWSGKRDDGTRLHDGVYFLRATGSGNETSRKLILLRGN